MSGRFVPGAICALWLVAAGAADGQPRKPKLPAGGDPGGVAIAIAAAGIDYTRPDIAAVLARDGEGDLIGWDTIDRDNRPYGAGAGDVAFARDVTAGGNRRLVPIRFDPARPATLAEAIAFAARTPAPILLLATAVDGAESWTALVETAARHPRLLIVVAGAGEPTAANPAERAVAPPNVLRVAATVATGIDVSIIDAMPPTMGLAAALVTALVRAPQRCARAWSGGRPAANRRYDRLLALLAPTAATATDGPPPCVVHESR